MVVSVLCILPRGSLQNEIVTFPGQNHLLFIELNEGQEQYGSKSFIAPIL